MFNKPACHGSCLVIIHPDRIINELSSNIEVVCDAVDADALNNRIDLMAPTRAFPFFRVEHDPVLDAIEQTAPWRIGEHDFDIWKTRFKEERNARYCSSGAGTAHKRIQ